MKMGILLVEPLFLICEAHFQNDLVRPSSAASSSFLARTSLRAHVSWQCARVLTDSRLAIAQVDRASELLAHLLQSKRQQKIYLVANAPSSLIRVIAHCSRPAAKENAIHMIGYLCEVSSSCEL